MKQAKYFLILFVLLLCLPYAEQATYGGCQTACDAGAVTCYTLVGKIFGVQSDATCSAAQGACMKACNLLF